jgi:hypothetical protein
MKSIKGFLNLKKMTIASNFPFIKSLTPTAIRNKRVKLQLWERTNSTGEKLTNSETEKKKRKTGRRRGQKGEM